jgi:hypothetical protein
LQEEKVKGCSKGRSKDGEKGRALRPSLSAI